MHQFFKSVFFNFEFVRILGATIFDGCEVGEALESVAKIKDQDPESWYGAWKGAGAKAEAIAKEACVTGDRNAARRAYLRASNYLRAAQFMLNSRPGFHDPRVLPTMEHAIENFRKGINLLEGDVHLLDIPYEQGINLPGYLYMPPTAKRIPGRKTPVLVSTGGADSTSEELYFIGAASGPALGYAVLTFEGPGQGIILRRDKLHLRPDWEVVIARVLDRLFDVANERPELNLDLERIGIAGATLGGYFALRGAADPRIKACVSVDPFYSMWDVGVTRMPAPFVNSWTSGWLGDSIFNSTINLLARFQFQIKWEFGHFQWAFGLDSPAAAMRELQKYSLKTVDGEEYLGRIKCPVLVTGAASSLYSKPDTSTTKIFSRLTQLPNHQKQQWIGEAVSDGGLQAKVGAFALAQQRTYAFLDKSFGIHRESLLI